MSSRRAIVAIAIALAAAAGATGAAGCGEEATADATDRLARLVPATARIVVAVDAPKVRGTWLATSSRALRALVATDRACVIDAVVAADRALVAELPRGWIVALAAAKPAACRALSQVETGLWIATLAGATAPRRGDATLAERPDFPAIRTALAAAPIAAVAPDGDPALGIVAAHAELGPATASMTLELTDAARAQTVRRWLEARLADAATRLGEAGALAAAIGVSLEGATITATLRGDDKLLSRTGPIAVIAAMTMVAAGPAAPAPTAPACGATRWPIECTDGVAYKVERDLRPTIEEAVRAAKPAARVSGGAIAGVRLGAVPADGILAALGLRGGDIVLALDGRRLDSERAIDLVAARLRDATRADITIERGGETFVIEYRTK